MSYGTLLVVGGNVGVPVIFMSSVQNFPNLSSNTHNHQVGIRQDAVQSAFDGFRTVISEALNESVLSIVAWAVFLVVPAPRFSRHSANALEHLSSDVRADRPNC